VISMAMWQHYTVEIVVFKEGTKRLAFRIFIMFFSIELL
jgi:hypothetical protein